MKVSSIATVGLVAVVTTVVAALMVNALLGDPADESVTISYMDVIEAEISDPDPEVFNNKAVNPTVEVYVGDCRAGEVWDEAQQRCMDEQTGGEETEEQEAEETEE